MQIRNRVRELRQVKAGDLVPNPKNWRAHPKAQGDALRGILAEVGYADALLARELPDGRLMLVDGHLRAETTPDLEVPVLVLDLDEAEADKLLLSLDPLAALAETNAVALDALLREVDTGSEGLQKMYADLAEAADLYKDDAKEIVEDEIPEPPADPITKPGDLWLLGDHRLLCGDSTKAPLDVMFDAVVTDPPYIIGAVSVGNARTKSGSWHDMMNSAQWFSAWYSAWWAKLKPTGFLASFGNWRTLPVMVKAAADAAIPLQSCLVWDKDWIGPASEKMLRVQYEICTIAAREQAAIRDRSRGDVVRIKWHGAVSNTTGHAAEKPVELLSWLVETLTETGGVVADPFCGSGTTLIAAEQLGRKCYGMEISPQYCDVIVKRWETLTGKKATREGGDDGKTRTAKAADEAPAPPGRSKQGRNAGR